MNSHSHTQRYTQIVLEWHASFLILFFIASASVSLFFVVCECKNNVLSQSWDRFGRVARGRIIFPTDPFRICFLLNRCYVHRLKRLIIAISNNSSYYFESSKLLFINISFNARYYVFAPFLFFLICLLRLGRWVMVYSFMLLYKKKNIRQK